MLTNRQSVVIESALRELSMRNKRRAHESNISIVALLFAHINGMDEGLKRIKQLREDGVNVVICPDDSIRGKYTNKELLEKTGANELLSIDILDQRKEQFNHFHLPITPFSLVGDLLQFNDSKKSIQLLLWALMRGKVVSVASSGADPYHAIWKHAGLNHGTPLLKRQMKAQLDQLKGYGIKLIKQYNDLLKMCEKNKETDGKKVITATDVEIVVKNNQSYIHVHQDTIITPLAKDIIKQKKMEVNKT